MATHCIGVFGIVADVYVTMKSTMLATTKDDIANHKTHRSNGPNYSTSKVRIVDGHNKDNVLTEVGPTVWMGAFIAPPWMGFNLCLNVFF